MGVYYVITCYYYFCPIIGVTFAYISYTTCMNNCYGTVNFTLHLISFKLLDFFFSMSIAVV